MRFLEQRALLQQFLHIALLFWCQVGWAACQWTSTKWHSFPIHTTVLRHIWECERCLFGYLNGSPIGHLDQIFQAAPVTQHACL